MTATLPPRDRLSGAPRPLLRYGWPLDLVFYGFALWWALGLANFVWQIAAVLLAARMIVDRRIKVPRGLGLFALFIGWSTLSSSQLDGSGEAIAFGYRLSLYLSAAIMFLFVYNSPRDRLPLRRVWAWMAALWVTIVAGGWLGVLIPDGGFSSVMELVLPASLTSDGFVQALIHPSFAQVQNFLGFPLGRPQAPFAYTNHWGSAFALLTPVIMLGWGPLNGRRYGMLLPLVLTLSLVPAILSLNRGMFLSLGVALVYAAARSGRTGARARRSLMGLVVVLVVLVAVTPLGGIVAAREENQHSNTGRFLLYRQAVDYTNDSPLIGFGAPQEVRGDRILPPVGTQGHFWLVMVSHGYVGLLLYLAAVAKLFRMTRRLPPMVGVAHLLVVIAGVQMFVYELTIAPHQILFIVLAVALRERDASDDAAVGADGGQPTRSPARTS